MLDTWVVKKALNPPMPKSYKLSFPIDTKGMDVRHGTVRHVDIVGRVVLHGVHLTLVGHRRRSLLGRDPRALHSGPDGPHGRRHDLSRVVHVGDRVVGAASRLERRRIRSPRQRTQNLHRKYKRYRP